MSTHSQEEAMKKLEGMDPEWIMVMPPVEFLALFMFRVPADKRTFVILPESWGEAH